MLWVVDPGQDHGRKAKLSGSLNRIMIKFLNDPEKTLSIQHLKFYNGEILLSNIDYRYK